MSLQKKNYKGGLFNPVFNEINFGICLKLRIFLIFPKIILSSRKNSKFFEKGHYNLFWRNEFWYMSQNVEKNTFSQKILSSSKILSFLKRVRTKKNYKGGLFNPVFNEMNFGICLKMRKKFNFFQKNCYNSKTIKGMNLKFWHILIITVYINFRRIQHPKGRSS